MKMRWVEKCKLHMAIRNAYKSLVGKPERKTPFGRPCVDGRIIIKLFLEKYDERVWTGFIWLR
jgi:hypothetical protein